ncbi:MAG: YidH family protein [Candidatus Binataceae bacterium]
MADQSAHSAPTLDLSTKLAFDRRWVAYERTMLAWVRTATSLITFGFSVYKFFQILRESSVQHNYIIGARQFGLLLVSIGLASAEYTDARSAVSGSPSFTGGHRRSFDLDSRHRGIDFDDLSAITPDPVSSGPEKLRLTRKTVRAEKRKSVRQKPRCIQRYLTGEEWQAFSARPLVRRWRNQDVWRGAFSFSLVHRGIALCCQE